MIRKSVKKKITTKARKKTTNKSPIVRAELESAERKAVLGVSALEEHFQGKYCNIAVIQHTEREFIFDFIWSLNSNRVLGSRVITSPKHAKEIHEVLGTNIKRYEKQFGELSPESVIKTQGT